MFHHASPELMASDAVDATTRLSARLFLRKVLVVVAAGAIGATGLTAVGRAQASPKDATGAWATVAGPLEPRRGHTATLLNDGKLLVAGGTNGTATLASSELYDRSTGAWNKVGDMSSPRSGHTATVLPNGNVLVVGGLDATGEELASVELYDLTAGTWSERASLVTARAAHTATLVGRKVLVAGGLARDLGLPVNLDLNPEDEYDCEPADTELFLVDPDCVALQSAELYDPVENKWSELLPMIHARGEHTATPLPDGTVLMAGGTLQDEVSTRVGSREVAEIFHPSVAGGAWTEAGALVHNRQRHTATVLPGGNVLLAGGHNCLTSPNRANGGFPCGTTASAEIFDATTRTWRPTGSFVTDRREEHTATALSDGTVLVAGGGMERDSRTNYRTPVASVELFDPASEGVDEATGAAVPGGWARVTRLTTARSNHTATALSDGAVLVAGGNFTISGDPVGAGAEVFQRFAQDRPPSVLSVAPSSGPAGGATQVVITGAGFLNTEAVTFGATAAPYFRVESGTRLVATTPPHAPGPVTVTVRNPAGTSTALGAATTFTYYEPGEGGWVPAPPSGRPRSGHTATVLGGQPCETTGARPEYCGRVLVTGGAGRAAELFEGSGTSVADGVTFAGRWLSTGSMATARAGHTATSLEDGTVLVAGGGTSAAERYDPGATDSSTGAAGVWKPTGPMTTSRSGHTATALGDGRVLVAGGGSETADVYDPDAVHEASGAKGRWTAIAPMTTPRSGHTATLLDDGRVLVAGGGSATAEVYDPEAVDPASGAKGRWTGTSPMGKGRSGHTATLLDDGRVLVAGGGHATAEVYDPDAVDAASGAKGRWTATAPMSTARSAHTATRLDDGRVLVVGGSTSFAELYEPATGAWRSTPFMVAVRPPSHAASLLPDGRVLVTGGAAQDGEGTSASAETFDPAPQRAPAIAVVDGQLGTTAGGTTVTIRGVRFFDPATTVEFGGKRAAHTRVTSDLEIVVVSPAHPRGTVDLIVSTPAGSSLPFRFLYTEGAWTPAGRLSVCQPGSPSCAPRAGHTATVLDDGRVLVAGGRLENGSGPPLGQGVSLASAEVYDPATGKWAATGSMNEARQEHIGVLLPDGRVLVAGGVGKESVQLASAELYDPKATDPATGLKGRWRSTVPMNASRPGSHTATLLNDEGDVLVVGGGGQPANDKLPAQFSTVAEVYDHQNGTWSPTEPMTRSDLVLHGHTATALSADEVLVTGGASGDGDPAIDAGQLFHRTTNRWTATAGPLTTARKQHTATRLTNGKVLLAGGRGGGTSALASVEFYDPVTATFAAAAPMHEARNHHRAAVLGDRNVLVVGGSERDSRSAELYDPVTNEWTRTGSTDVVDRRRPTLNVLDRGACGPRCGGALLVGGSSGFERAANIDVAELYMAGPEVTTIAPSSGPTAGGTAVVINGTGLHAATKVTFGGVEATSVFANSSTRLTAITPPHRAGVVDVVVTSPGGASLAATPVRFTYSRTDIPGGITDLAADVVSDVAVRLSFSTAGTDGAFEPPATRYDARLAGAPIVDAASFEAATPVCEGAVCEFPGATLPGTIALVVDGLDPGTTYHFAVRAIGTGGAVGPLSNPASATTTGTVPGAPSAPCPDVRAPGAGELLYPSGYSMVGLPEGTRLGAQSPLYGWFDAGAGGVYSVNDPTTPVAGGRGYWAWFSCPSVIAPSSPGTTEATLPLGRYRASMVGNPSGTDAVRVTGQDFAARWDPRLNNGAGGYRISKLREEQVLPVGQATWVFSYRDTTIQMAAG